MGIVKQILKKFIPTREGHFDKLYDKLRETIRNNNINIKNDIKNINNDMIKLDDNYNFIIENTLFNNYYTKQQKYIWHKKLYDMLHIENSEEIKIVFISDEFYIQPTRVAISSLLRNRNNETKYSIYVILVDCDEKEEKQFEIFSKAVNILLIQNTLKNIGNNHQHVSKAALIKFSLAEILDGIDKILYLDSDIIVNDDLSALYSQDITNKFASVVKDAKGIINGYHEKIEVDTYFNSGVMLLNLEKMRNDDICKKLIQAKEMLCPIDGFMDQNAFNYIFNNHVLFMSPKFNYMYSNNLIYQDSVISDIYEIDVNQYNKIKNNPTILHLTNKTKPWNSSHAPKYAEYRREEIILMAAENEFTCC